MRKPDHTALKAAKIARTEANTSLTVAVKAAGAAADRRDAKADDVQALATERAASVAAGDIGAISALDEKLSRARISLEVEIAAASRFAVEQAGAEEALRQACTAVDSAALDVLNAEMVAQADEFIEDLDAALAKGARLRALAGVNDFHVPLNRPLRTLPSRVTEALARMPKVDDLNVSVAVLRGVGTYPDGFAARLLELAA